VLRRIYVIGREGEELMAACRRSSSRFRKLIDRTIFQIRSNIEDSIKRIPRPGCLNFGTMLSRVDICRENSFELERNFETP
jgi:hypothetical protein